MMKYFVNHFVANCGWWVVLEEEWWWLFYLIIIYSQLKLIRYNNDLLKLNLLNAILQIQHTDTEYFLIPNLTSNH